MNKILFLFSLFLIACSNNRQLVNNDIALSGNSFAEINIVNDTKQIEFVIRNINESPIYVVNSIKLRIERKDNEIWEKLRILPCPCDAPCFNDQENIEIAPNDVYKIIWNLEESWCGKERVNNIRNTETQRVEKGVYRIAVTFKTIDKTSEIIYKEFEL